MSDELDKEELTPRELAGVNEPERLRVLRGIPLDEFHIVFDPSVPHPAALRFSGMPFRLPLASPPLSTPF